MATNNRYTVEVLTEAVSNSTSFAGVLRFLGLRQAGGTQAHVARRIRALGIETSHFTGQAHARGRPSTRRRSPEQILIVRPTGSFREKPPVLRRALVEIGRPYLCAQWIGPERLATHPARGPHQRRMARQSAREPSLPMP